MKFRRVLPKKCLDDVFKKEQLQKKNFTVKYQALSKVSDKSELIVSCFFGYLKFGENFFEI